MPTIADTFRLTGGDLQSVFDQARADAARDRGERERLAAVATIEADVRAWQRLRRPDHLDRAWQNWQAFERMVSDTPYPRHQTRGWARGVGRTRKTAVNYLATASPDNHATERFSW